MALRLELDPEFADGYRSPAQRARRMTEGWFARNMYCPACDSPRLAATRDNTRVVDFICPGCGAEFQLKAKRGSFGRKVVDAAYAPMVQRARENRSPHFAFLGYDSIYWRVSRLLLVPGHFITPDVIERRKALRKSARRAGWVGCNLLLERVPPDGRVGVVCENAVVPPESVRAQWARYEWLSGTRPEQRTWTVDVLRCVRSLGKSEFTLAEVYSFEEELAASHPKNRHVRDKIRQQLQVLRDKGVLEFLGGGRYLLL